MKLTACIITLKENLVPKGATTEQPAWLRAKASITLDNKITLHGLVIRDVVANSGVFVTYPKLPVLTDQYDKPLRLLHGKGSAHPPSNNLS